MQIMEMQIGTIGIKKRHVARGGKISFSERGK
jgi:hypothetical protein